METFSTLIGELKVATSGNPMAQYRLLTDDIKNYLTAEIRNAWMGRSYIYFNLFDGAFTVGGISRVLTS